MKKVLSLVLVFVMVFGMSITTFAATAELIKNQTGAALTTGTKVTAYYDLKTIDQNTDYSGTDAFTIKLANISNTGVYWDDTIGSDFDLTYSSSLAAIFDKTAYTTVSIVANELVLELYTKDNLERGKAFEGELTLTSASGGALILRITGKVSSEAGKTSANTIPSNVKIVGILNTATLGFWDRDFYALTGDTKVKTALTPDMFVWEFTSGAQKGEKVIHTDVMDWDPADLRPAHVKDISLRKTNPINNNGTIKDVYIDGTDAVIETVKYFLKCGSTEGSFDVQLAYKSRAGGTASRVHFEIANDETLLEDGQLDVFTNDHIYVKADVSIRAVEMEVGENLFITKSFAKGQKAYCRASIELSAGDEKLFMEYPELDAVYTLYSVGVASAGVTARFDLADTYFVYDKNFKLIGTTADSKLPWSDKYYLTTKKVDLAGTPAVEEDPSTEPAPDLGNENLGGGNAPAANANYNPNTGL